MSLTLMGGLAETTPGQSANFVHPATARIDCSIPDSAIAALADLLLDLVHIAPLGPGCVRCGDEPSHASTDGWMYCELCRGC